MATVTSSIYLCSGVPLSNRYDHTLYFTSRSEQLTYFTSKTAHQVDEVTYLRKSWSIKILADMGSARKWNYLYFENPDDRISSGNKRNWYYFVTDVEYINDNTVELFLELDVMQSYMFDWTLNPCFIERQHTLNDGLGESTIDEGLDTGDLVVSKTLQHYWNDCCILILSTIALGNSELPNITSASYNGIFGGAGVFAVNAIPSKMEALGGYLDMITAQGKIDAIISMWMYPKELVTLADGYSWEADPVAKPVKGCDFVNAELPGITYSDTETLGGYKPKNRKLLQYPYNFIYATNNNGGAAVYKYEHFADERNPRVNMFGTISAEGVAYMYPLNYKGTQHNYDEGLQLGGFPTCAWNADVYKLWLAQNQNQQQLAMATGALQIAGGAIAVAASGGGAIAAGGGAAIIHGVTSIQQIMAQRADMAIQPPQSRGNHSGSLNFTAGQVGYTFFRKTVDASHARAIDDFFTMYGYAIHNVKRPAICTRPYWTYVKTRDSNVTGNIPHNDLQKINQIFDAGVTFWVGGAHVGDYTLDNSPT